MVRDLKPEPMFFVREMVWEEAWWPRFRYSVLVTPASGCRADGQIEKHLIAPSHKRPGDLHTHHRAAGLTDRLPQ